MRLLATILAARRATPVAAGCACPCMCCCQRSELWEPASSLHQTFV